MGKNRKLAYFVCVKRRAGFGAELAVVCEIVS